MKPYDIIGIRTKSIKIWNYFRERWNNIPLDELEELSNRTTESNILLNIIRSSSSDVEMATTALECDTDAIYSLNRYICDPVEETGLGIMKPKKVSFEE